MNRFKKNFKIILIISALAILFYLNRTKEYYDTSSLKFDCNDEYEILNLNTELEKEFEKIENKYCNVNNYLKYYNSCLNEMSNFDVRLKLKKSFKDKNDCKQCIHYRKKSKNNRIDKFKNTSEDVLIVYHHTFWQLQKPNFRENIYYFRIMKLNIMSYLVTQNLCCTKLIFWKLADFPQIFETELIKTFGEYIKERIIQIKTFNITEICLHEETSFKETILCKLSFKVDFSNGNMISVSDLVRFMVLDIYGGIYTDGDVVLLKNMQILWNYNFAYRWSSASYVNTAILGINKILNPSVKMFYKELTGLMTPKGFFRKIFLDLITAYDFSLVVSMFHPFPLSEPLKKTLTKENLSFYSFKIFSSLLFDGAWLCFDNSAPRLSDKHICDFKEFTEKEFMSKNDFDPTEFFKGSFTYHQHMAASQNISPHSYFNHLEKSYYSFLNI